ncbi:hypothetical protein NUM3379_12060 [Kineococcus sp. NUM-3379]
MTEPSPRPSPVGWLVLTVLLVGGGLLLLVPPLVRALTAEDFHSRQALPTCPAVTLLPGGVAPPGAWDCLLAAAADRRGAEQEVRTSTTGGGTLSDHYRTLPGRQGLEVYADSGRAVPGAGRWGHEWCPEAVSPDDVGACRPG